MRYRFELGEFGRLAEDDGCQKRAVDAAVDHSRRPALRHRLERHPIRLQYGVTDSIGVDYGGTFSLQKLRNPALPRADTTTENYA